jgi:glutamate-ammonia-ligase adenylyltransferase
VFNPRPPSLPRPADPDLAATLRRDWVTDDTLDPVDRAFAATAAADPATAAILDAVLGNSPFLARQLSRHPDVLRIFVTDGPAAAVAREQAGLQSHPDDGDLPALMRVLRHAKARTALAIGLADLTATWDVDTVVQQLSVFADTAIAKALRGLLAAAHARGKLTHADPDACGYIVLAVGKLGAHELNYSSDIDLFVLFDPQRLPYTGKKSPQEFAVELTKDLVRVLEERTGDGYVFRTDLRLRPDPGSTAIAVSRDAAQTYYESYGQNWERAALIKARFVAGDGTTATEFLRDLQPFIWRKSLDFYAIQDIHSIKRQIYAHKGGSVIQVAGHNIKLGRGGIREIEFFVQTQQLIWGGRLPETRVPQTLRALDVLTELGFVAPAVRDDLAQAYRFLRRLEHRLQMIADEQTQTLPADDKRRAHLAVFMGYPDLPAFERDVENALRTVETHYAGLFEDAPSLTVGGNLVFTGTEDDPDTLETLRRLGFSNPSTVGAMVRGWHHGRYRATRSNRARQILTEIIPGLLTAFGRTTQADAALVRFDRCLSELQSGIQLLSVFQANPQLLDLVAEIMGDAPRLADHLARNPALLDYVLEPQFYAAMPDLGGLQSDLQQTLQAAPSFESVLDLCRRWANDQRFRTGVQTLRGQIAPERGANHLADIAEAVLNGLTPHVAADFARQFGTVPDSRVAILAYGKLGSRELTPTSDLDLVVVYDGRPEAMSSGGPRSLSLSAYYTRFTQRLVTALTLLTREGTLYDVDLRLRPDGDKGPPACSLAAFTKYHRESAWTWEHMALTRARPVYGDATLRSEIAAVIAETLARPRNPETLRQDVADMRRRMRKEHPGQGPWDLKHRPGGLIDGEFIVQHAALAGGCDDLAPAEGMIGLVARLQAHGHLQPAQADVLSASLLLWLRLQVMLRLTVAEELPQDLPLGLQAKLAAAAGAPDLSGLEARMDEVSAAVSGLFQDMIDSRRD